jgi:hypothetical protein
MTILLNSSEWGSPVYILSGALSFPETVKLGESAETGIEMRIAHVKHNTAITLGNFFVYPITPAKRPHIEPHRLLNENV